MQLLLISNSGRPFLQQYKEQLSDFLTRVRTVAVVTAARLVDEDAYYQVARETLEEMCLLGSGVEVIHLRWNDNPLKVLGKVEALFVGGGNTYLLLKRLREAKLIHPIHLEVLKGMPYIGVSGGANIAGPNILTTNDWNVVSLDNFQALDLISFNINPHYLQTDPTMAPYSETRDERILEYLQVQGNPVLGLEEGTLIRVEEERATVLGKGRVKFFSRDLLPRWYSPQESFAVNVMNNKT